MNPQLAFDIKVEQGIWNKIMTYHLLFAQCVRGGNRCPLQECVDTLLGYSYIQLKLASLAYAFLRPLSTLFLIMFFSISFLSSGSTLGPERMDCILSSLKSIICFAILRAEPLVKFVNTPLLSSSI